MKKTLTYKSSGVDLRKADEFIKDIQGVVKQTQSNLVLNRTSAFGPLFALTKTYREPVLVASTDGVGTKLLLAKYFGKHDTIGIDLVAMNVNDVLCVGAKPLFFLDYIACGKVNPKVLHCVVKGIAAGCRESDCALIGGETAEMPGLYQSEDYDLAGFALGVVEKKNIIDGTRMQAGDRIIGLAASGLHSNGYSLVRKVLSARDLKKYASVLLSPTRIYVKSVLKAIAQFEIKGIAHNTGGAFLHKLTRIVPSGLCLAIDSKSWSIPEIFQIIQKKGTIADREMRRTFNLGIGMIVIVPAFASQVLCRFFRNERMECWNIGEVIKDHDTKLRWLNEKSDSIAE